MKQRKIVSMLGALIVIMSAVVFISGCSQANSNENNSTLKISFDELKIECKRNDLMVKSGITVADGEAQKPTAFSLLAAYPPPR